MPRSYPAQTLALEGADALSFAHAQFSSNVLGLKTGEWQFSAWLDAQGRVRFFFHLARLADDRLLLLLRGGDAVSMAEALQRFVFRARVRIVALSPCALGTGPTLPLHAVRQAGDAFPTTFAQADPGTLFFGCAAYSLMLGNAVEPDDAWRLPQIRAFWPWLPDNALDHWLSPALGLDRLGATALDKGCYPGQEMVARLHYRGGHKRHLGHVMLSLPLAANTVLRQGDRELMRLLDAIPAGAGGEALAVVPDDAATDLLMEADTGASAVQVTIRGTLLSPGQNADSAQ